MFEFSPAHGVALSNVTIFGGSIANLLMNLPKRHPLTDRPLIDWDLLLAGVRASELPSHEPTFVRIPTPRFFLPHNAE